MELWEKLVIGVFALLLVFWLFPGIKTTLAESKHAPTDWAGVLVPIVLVVLFILFLIATL